MIKHYLFLIIALLIGGYRQAEAQEEIPHHEEAVDVRFGSHSGMPIDNATELYAEGNRLELTGRLLPFPPSEYTRVERMIASNQHAPWVQLYFEDVNLGANSYLILTSMHDGDRQYFDARSIEIWQNISGYFKGGEVQVELFVAPDDRNIQLTVSKIVVGEFYSEASAVAFRTICGPDDDRVQSAFSHIDARLYQGGCSAWISAGGFMLTAGHCGINNGARIEFYVPASLCDGTTQPAALVDQYPAVTTNMAAEENGIGNDWRVFTAGPNSNTMRTPREAQRAYYHLSRSVDPPDIMIRGFGSDEDPDGCGITTNRNSDNFTLQFHTGSSDGESIDDANDAQWGYEVDTEGGNSGSAILTVNEPGVDFTSIGIHTNGGCGEFFGSNSGTSLEADDLENACNTFWQDEVEYADVDHHLSSVTGTSVLPHFSVQNAVNQADAGHGPGDANLELILIAGSNFDVGGIYQEAFHYAGHTHGVVLRRTVGAVRIGPNATAKPLPVANQFNGDLDGALAIQAVQREREAQSASRNATTFSVYPNPTGDIANIRFSLSEAMRFQLDIYDLNGKRVQTLADEPNGAAGVHEVRFDARGLPTGIYLARLAAGGEIKTLRLGISR